MGRWWRLLRSVLLVGCIAHKIMLLIKSGGLLARNIKRCRLRSKRSGGTAAQSRGSQRRAGGEPLASRQRARIKLVFDELRSPSGAANNSATKSDTSKNNDMLIISVRRTDAWARIGITRYRDLLRAKSAFSPIRSVMFVFHFPRTPIYQGFSKLISFTTPFGVPKPN